MGSWWLGVLSIFFGLWIAKKLLDKLPSWTELFHLGATKKQAPKGGVVLYQVGRGMFVPSASPYPLKLETYLRMAKVPYVNDHSGRLSSKSKTPWMECDGEAVADSQLCIEHLRQKMDVSCTADLTSRQQAAGRALVKMVEESLYWSLAVYTFGDDLSSLRRVFPFGKIAFFVFSRYLRYVVRKQLWAQGMGRHTFREATEMGVRDLAALSDYLGDNEFILGTEPCEYDCSIFAMLCQVLYHNDGSPQNAYMSKTQNLVEYVQRMKLRYWPDWDECILSSDKYNPEK